MYDVLINFNCMHSRSGRKYTTFGSKQVFFRLSYVCKCNLRRCVCIVSVSFKKYSVPQNTMLCACVFKDKKIGQQEQRISYIQNDIGSIDVHNVESRGYFNIKRNTENEANEGADRQRGVSNELMMMKTMIGWWMHYVH